MTPRTAQLQAAYDECRAIAKREAKNFYYAFRVLPEHKSDAMCAMYAFMRKADDLADDESLSLDARRDAMVAWTGAWRASRAGGSDDPVFLAVNDTQQQFKIPADLLEQLVAGTTLDLDPRPAGVRVHILEPAQAGLPSVQVYENFAALQHYCYLVASVVGLVCIRIFGYTDRRAEQLAVDTGIAFQLTNILRDIREDAERGRIYLPADLLREHSVTPEHVMGLLANLQPTAADFALLNGLEKHAQTLYRSGYALIPLLAPDAQPAMRVLVRIYHRLLDRIARNPAAVFATRVSVPTSEKLAILAGGVVGSLKARVLS